MRSGGVFDVAGKSERMVELEAAIQAPGFWDDQQVAQKSTQELSSLRDTVEAWDGILRRVQDGRELYAMGEDDPDLLRQRAAQIMGDIGRHLLPQPVALR